MKMRSEPLIFLFWYLVNENCKPGDGRTWFIFLTPFFPSKAPFGAPVL